MIDSKNNEQILQSLAQLTCLRTRLMDAQFEAAGIELQLSRALTSDDRDEIARALVRTEDLWRSVRKAVTA